MPKLIYFISTTKKQAEEQMRIYRRFFALFLTALMLAVSADAMALENAVFKTKLDNGLTVIIDEVHSAPVVAIEMWVRVGGADEQESEAGLSHVFEHMLFKGTEKRKVGEIASTVESVGGDINAFTSFDNTVYHLAVPSRQFLTGLDIISDAVQHSSFVPVELKKELEVVLEELRMNQDSPGRSLYKTLLATSYTAHPYRRPVIGYEDVIKNLKRDELLRFFKRWYIPGNMTLVIAGDVGRETALAAVKESIGGFPPGEDPHKPRPVEPAQKGLRISIATQEIKETHLGIAFHIPELKNPDTYAIDALAGVLGGGASSRLYKKLKIEDTLVHDISVYPMSLKEPGVFIVNGTLDARNMEKALPEALFELKRISIDGPRPDELQKVKLNIESDFVYSRETMQGIADKLGYYETISGDYNYEKKYLEGIRAVTADDVRRAAAKYLADENMSIAVIMPKSDKDVINAGLIEQLVKRSGEMARKEEAAHKAEGATTKVRLDNGITLIVKEVHSNPTVAFYAAFPGGLRFETSAYNGIGNFTAQMLTRGTKTRTREDIARNVEEMAGGVSGFSGWNSTGVSGKFLSTYFDKGLDIFADVIMNPSFPDGEIVKLKKDVLDAIKSQEDSLPTYTFKLLYKSLYRTHPYGMPVIGTPEAVSALKREDLLRHHGEFFTPQRMVLTIVGDLNRDYAIERVNSLFKGFKAATSPLPATPVENRQAGIRETGAVKEKAQTNIAMGFLATSIGQEDGYALKVLTEVLSGQGGRLFLDLRDKQSLAYSVTALLKEGKDPGIFGVYIAAAPQKKDAAVAGILDELRKAQESKVTEDEMRRAKNSLIGGYEIGLQEVSDQASDMANNELYGLGYDFRDLYPKKIDAVTADDVLRVAKKYITLDAYTISVVGPNGRTN